jgi:putative nucleotidyltransferase with HDIG domain
MAPLTLQQLLASNVALPSCPQVLLRLMNVLHDSEVQSDQIVDLISTDPALTLEVVRVANSPLYGAVRQIRSVSDALMRLGLHEVWSITSALKTKELFASSNAAWTGMNARLWEHSLKVASAARSLSTLLNPRNIEVFFTAGILHDCGKLLLVRAYPGYVQTICEDDAVWGDKLILREQREFESDHAKLGAELLEHWKIPGSLSKLVADHHKLPVESTSSNAVALLRLADRIARDVALPLTDRISLPINLVNDCNLDQPTLKKALTQYAADYKKLQNI